jgi:transcriptional regulator with XRE-family HTH domain
MNEGEKLRRVLAKTGLQAKEFAKSLDISESVLSKLLAGTRQPSREVLRALAGIYGVDLNEFIFGSGASAVSEMVYVELIKQEAAAGRGIEVDDYVEKLNIALPYFFIAPYRAERVKAVFVHGDSMIDEKIDDGDIVLFNTAETSGENIFVVSVGSTLLVKRISFDVLNGSLSLLSANSAYPPRVISGADLDSVKVEGRVIACLHRV